MLTVFDSRPLRSFCSPLPRVCWLVTELHYHLWESRKGAVVSLFSRALDTGRASYPDVQCSGSLELLLR